MLEHEISPDPLGLLAPTLDEDYLDQLGLLGHVECWREAAASKDFGNAALKILAAGTPKASEEESPAALAPEPPAPATSEPQSVPARSFGRRKWIYAGAVAAVIVGLVLCAASFINVPDQTPPVPTPKADVTPPNTVADTGNAQPPPSVAETPPATSQPATNTVAESASAAVPAPFAISPLVVRARTASADTNATSAETNTTSADTDVAAVPHKPSFKLQGILYSPRDPFVIINGKTLHKGGIVDGARVEDITLNAVTLIFNDERVTLKVK